jgi:predicted nucleic acid-binding protein
MPVTSYLIDSNILLRWVKPDDRDYPLVVTAIEAILGEGGLLCYTSQNVAEFWNACTRPLEQNGFALSPQETDRRARLFEDKLMLLPDSVAVHQEWRALLVRHSISGVQVHDARLVAAMHIHGIERVLTFNERDFARFPDIQIVHPKAFQPKHR